MRIFWAIWWLTDNLKLWQHWILFQLHLWNRTSACSILILFSFWEILLVGKHLTIATKTFLLEFWSNSEYYFDCYEMNINRAISFVPQNIIFATCSLTDTLFWTMFSYNLYFKVKLSKILRDLCGRFRFKCSRILPPPWKHYAYVKKWQWFGVLSRNDTKEFCHVPTTAMEEALTAVRNAITK